MAQAKKSAFSTKPMTPARKDDIRAIKTAWGIDNVEDIFEDCNSETHNMLRPGEDQTSDDFFEDATLTMLRQLAEITRGETDAVKVKLRRRWRARTKGGENPPRVGALKAGANAKEKNKNLRVDLQDFVTEFKGQSSSSGAAESGAGPSGSKRRRDTDDGDDERREEPPSRKTRSQTTQETTSARERQEEALSFIRTAWPRGRAQDKPFDFSILPEHAYDPVTLNLTRPFKFSNSLLLTIHRLAQATTSRRSEVRAALTVAFQDAKNFDKDEAVQKIETVAKRFEEENKNKKSDQQQEEKQEKGKQVAATVETQTATAPPAAAGGEVGETGYAKETSVSPGPPATVSLPTDLPTLRAQTADLRGANDSLLASLAQGYRPTPPSTSATLTTVTFDHLLALSQLNEAGLALEQAKLRSAHMDADTLEVDRGEIKAEDRVLSAKRRMAGCQLRVEESKAEILKTLKERMGEDGE